MLKPLTNEQQIKVEENMGLVGKVIQDCVHTLGAAASMTMTTCSRLDALAYVKPPRRTSQGIMWPFRPMPTA